MFDSKLCIVDLWLDIVAILVEGTMELYKKTLVSPFREPALFIQKVKDSQSLTIKEFGRFLTSIEFLSSYLYFNPNNIFVKMLLWSQYNAPPYYYYTYGPGSILEYLYTSLSIEHPTKQFLIQNACTKYWSPYIALINTI